MAASAHLRGIAIAGVLAVIALGLGFMTLAMNQSSSSAATHTVLSLKQRGLASAKSSHAKPAKKVHHKAPNVHLVAALKAGLPRSVAQALAAKPVVVVALTSASDAVAGLSMHEAQAGARLAGAAFVSIGVDRDGGDASKLTALLGSLPAAPATLVYVRPASLVVQLPGFNDRTVVQQAAHSALSMPAPAATQTQTTPPATTTTVPAVTTPAPAAT